MKRFALQALAPSALLIALLMLAPRTPGADDTDQRVVAPGPTRGDQKKQPKIATKFDGSDLIVSTEVLANNSPHALWTAYQTTGNAHNYRHFDLRLPPNDIVLVPTSTVA